MPVIDFIDIADEEDIFEALADSNVVYCGKPVYAVIDYTMQPDIIQDSYVIERQITALFLKKDVPNIKRGSEFTHNNCKLVVSQIIQDTKTHVHVSATPHGFN